MLQGKPGDAGMDAGIDAGMDAGMDAGRSEGWRSASWRSVFLTEAKQQRAVYSRHAAFLHTEQPVLLVDDVELRQVCRRVSAIAQRVGVSMHTECTALMLLHRGHRLSVLAASRVPRHHAMPCLEAAAMRLAVKVHERQRTWERVIKHKAARCWAQLPAPAVAATEVRILEAVDWHAQAVSPWTYIARVLEAAPRLDIMNAGTTPDRVIREEVVRQVRDALQHPRYAWAVPSYALAAMAMSHARYVLGCPPWCATLSSAFTMYPTPRHFAETVFPLLRVCHGRNDKADAVDASPESTANLDDVEVLSQGKYEGVLVPAQLMTRHGIRVE